MHQIPTRGTTSAASPTTRTKGALIRLITTAYDWLLLVLSRTLLVLFSWGRRSDLSSFSTLSMLPFFDVSQVSKFSLRQFAVATVSAF